MSRQNPLVSIKGFVPKTVEVLKAGYTASMLGKDVFAGLTVGVIALPLAIAFAIGAGATPAQGLWTAIIAGFAISALGGSRYQVAGPTGAFVVIIAGVIAKHGMEGLIAATAIAGILLVIMGISGLGKLVKFIPYPVTIGFTTGIGVVIAGGQIKDFFGLDIPHYPTEFFARLAESARNIATLDVPTLSLGLTTIACILLIRRFAPKIPAAIVAIGLVAAVAWIFKLPVETIGSRYGSIPKGLPGIRLPLIGWATIRDVFPSAVTIAMLGSIESLLSAVVADGMTGDRHNSNMELVAQGLGNVLSSLFGGIPATGAIARTAANIKSGAVSPISGMVHAIVLLVFTIFLSGLASAIPLASLAGILLIVAWDMSELRHFMHMRYAPKSDLIVMLVTFALTVAVDLTVAVQVGVILAVFLFIRRVNETASISPLRNMLNSDYLDGLMAEKPVPLPKGVELYEIQGPFYFGTADFLQEALDQVAKAPRVFILRLRHVPSIDASGLNALETFRKRCAKHGTVLVLSGVRPQPRKALGSIGLVERIGEDNIFETIDEALSRASVIVSM